MTCPACGQEERQDRKMVLDWRKRGGPPTLHRECPSGHAWHLPLVLRQGTEPAPCDCEAEA
jgi:hypothetical protein